LTIPWRYGIIKIDQERHNNDTEGAAVMYTIFKEYQFSFRGETVKTGMRSTCDHNAVVAGLKILGMEYGRDYERVKRLSKKDFTWQVDDDIATLVPTGKSSVRYG
jgi:hypothetical protein